MSIVAQPLAYTVGECADALRVSKRTIRRAIAAGKLRVIRVGRLVRVPAESLRQFMEGEGAQASGPITKSDERRHTKSKPELNECSGNAIVLS